MPEYTAEIVGIKDETHDVKTFRLKPELEVDFIPGQYCVVAIVGHEKFEKETRPFTYSSSPTEKDFTLTIKKVGDFTSTLHENVKIGDELKIWGPRGESLNFNEEVKGNVAFIAGGSGITPFMSAIRYTFAKDLKNNLMLFFSNRLEKDIINRKEFDELNGEKLKVVYTLTKEEPDGWKGELGRVNEEMIKKHLPEFKDWVWYVCGPPPMVKGMNELLLSMGVAKEKIKWEDWQIPGKHDKK